MGGKIGDFYFTISLYSKLSRMDIFTGWTTLEYYMKSSELCIIQYFVSLSYKLFQCHRFGWSIIKTGVT